MLLIQVVLDLLSIYLLTLLRVKETLKIKEQDELYFDKPQICIVILLFMYYVM